MVKTSQAHLGELIDTWNRILEEADEILYLPISSGLSGSYQSACTAAAGFDGRVTVVDARFACYPLTWLCLWAKRQLEEGYSCAQIKDKIEKEAELWAALIPEKLEYLKRGGRISPAGRRVGKSVENRSDPESGAWGNRCSGEGSYGQKGVPGWIGRRGGCGRSG